MLTITMLYAGLLGLLCIGVAAIAGTMRGKKGISVGDGGNPDLLLAMRRHANFIEWVPITLILIGLLEFDGVSKTVIHVMGAGLVAARILHAIGVKRDSIESIPRLIGAAGNALIVVVASIWCIKNYFV